LNERATSTQQTGFSFVAQMRSWLPDPLGGILWFGVDDTYSTVYVPMYCGIRKAPKAYAVGTADFNTFSWDSAFWVFNWMSNFVYLRYSEMIRDVQTVQRQLEGHFVALQPEVDKAAMNLYSRAPELARDYLTRISARRAKETVKRIRKLTEDLLVKYKDGNLRDSTGKVTHPGYPESWYRRVIKEKGQQFLIHRLPGEPEEKPKKKCVCPPDGH
jgi:dipeptidase